MSTVQKKMNSKIGPLYLVASEKGLKGILWKKQPDSMALNADSPEARHIAKAEIQLEEYLNGEREDFDLILDPDGTEFQKRVWHQLSQIPYGKTLSYKDIALKLNDKGASRAVGTANGKNPLSIVVPCHRVISSDGSLGGHAGGLDIKTKLLHLERTGKLG